VIDIIFDSGLWGLLLVVG